jgi:hypothetical protein
MIIHALVAYLIFYMFWCFFFQETHTQWPQNLWAAFLGVHITGSFLFIIILIIVLILLFDHFRDRLGYCLATFNSKIFVHLFSLKFTI